MAITDYLAEQTVTLNPTQTRCHCGKSMVLPKHPTIHCPRCHRTYQARTLHYPVNCPACDYNLRVWRQRNGIEELDVFQGAPRPAPARATHRHAPKPKAKAAATRRKPGPKPKAA
jgi:Zn finger protein HypA/HybF involved in hydrogenase expression